MGNMSIWRKGQGFFCVFKEDKEMVVHPLQSAMSRVRQTWASYFDPQ